MRTSLVLHSFLVGRGSPTEVALCGQAGPEGKCDHTVSVPSRASLNTPTNRLHATTPMAVICWFRPAGFDAQPPESATSLVSHRRGRANGRMQPRPVGPGVQHRPGLVVLPRREHGPLHTEVHCISCVWRGVGRNEVCHQIVGDENVTCAAQAADWLLGAQRCVGAGSVGEGFISSLVEVGQPPGPAGTRIRVCAPK